MVFKSAAFAMLRGFTSDDFMSRASWQVGNTGSSDGVAFNPKLVGVQLGSNTGSHIAGQ